MVQRDIAMLSTVTMILIGRIISEWVELFVLRVVTLFENGTHLVLL